MVMLLMVMLLVVLFIIGVLMLYDGGHGVRMLFMGMMIMYYMLVLLDGNLLMVLMSMPGHPDLLRILQLTMRQMRYTLHRNRRGFVAHFLILMFSVVTMLLFQVNLMIMVVFQVSMMIVVVFHVMIMLVFNMNRRSGTCACMVANLKNTVRARQCVHLHNEFRSAL